MHAITTLSGPVIALGLFASVVSGAMSRLENNWFKLAAAVYGLSLVIPATSSFSALQSASAIELFSFIAYALGVAAGTLLPFQVKRGGWLIAGLLPQWESQAVTKQSKSTASSRAPGA